MSDSSDKQLTAGDCGRLLPPNLHVLLDTVQKLSLALTVKQVKKYKLQHTNAFVSYNSENECLFAQ